MKKIKEDETYIYIQPARKIDEKLLQNAGGEYIGDGTYRLSKESKFIGVFIKKN